MSTTIGVQVTTFNSPNLLGQLFYLTPKEAPLLTAIGDINGAQQATTKRIYWTAEDNPVAAQPAILEGANMTPTARDRTDVYNVLQIFHEGLEISYTKQAAINTLGTPTVTAPNVNNQTQAVTDEAAHQINLKIMKIRRDLEYTLINGVFAEPVDNATARKTRGLLAAITTNAVAAAGGDLGSGSTNYIDTIMKTAFDGGAPLRDAILLLNSTQKLKISRRYGFAPEHRNVGGVNIEQIETDFGVVGTVLDRFVPSDTLLLVDLSVLKLHFMQRPGVPLFGAEPIAKIGLADRWQLSGEIGLEYGPESWHAKVTGLSTTLP